MNERNDAGAGALPRTVEDAVAYLMEVCENTLLMEIRDGSEDDLVAHHFGLGMWIRNNLGLWQGNTGLMNELGSFEPDDASHQLLVKLRERLQGWEPPRDARGNVVVKYPDAGDDDGIEIIDLGDCDPEEQTRRTMEVIRELFGLEGRTGN